MMAQTKTVVTQNGEKVAISTGAKNGLTANNGYIQLGGALTQPSVLTTTSAYTLAIQGLQAGAASDNVLVSDANGVLKFVPRSSFTGADNLGNHTATQNLDMTSKNILNINNAYIKNEAQIMDRVTSNTNYFGIYKNSGLLGIWNNLHGNNALSIDEATNKTTLVSAQIAHGTDGSTPALGSVAVAADANGNVKWVSPSTIGAGDNLGNHTATTDLAMSGKNINNAANVTATGTVAAANVIASAKATVQTAQITKGSDGASPAAGSIAVAADTNGNVKWVSASSIGAGDNLGNHTATTDLAMSGKNINNAANITATGKTSTEMAQIIKGSDGVSPAIGSVAVAADTNGNVKWVSASTLGAGDNLGNHTATKDLAMSGKNISNAANITATGKTTTNSAQIAKGTNGVAPQAGYIATAADTSGNVVWIAATSAPGAIDGVYEFLGTSQINVPSGTTTKVPMNGSSFTLNKPGKVLITYSLLPLPANAGQPVQGSIDLIIDNNKTISSYYSASDAPSGLGRLGNYSTAQKIASLAAGTHTIGLNLKSWYNTTMTNVNPVTVGYNGSTASDSQAMIARITVIVFND